MVCTSAHDRILTALLPAGMRSTPPCFEETIQRLSVSQNKCWPCFSLTHASVMLRRSRPPEQMSEANGGKNNGPGASITSEESVNSGASPENTLTGTFSL